MWYDNQKFRYDQKSRETLEPTGVDKAASNSANST